MNTVYLAVPIAAALLGQFFDGHSTEVALSHGWVETNSFWKWFISKTSVSAMVAFKCIVLAQALPVLGYVTGGNLGLAVVGSIVAADGFYAGIKNYILLKKKGIAVF